MRLEIGNKVQKKYWNIIGKVIETDSSKMDSKGKKCCVNPDNFVQVKYNKHTEWTNKSILIKL